MKLLLSLRIVLISLPLLASIAWAGDEWSNTFGIQATHGNYAASSTRKTLTNEGAIFSTDYLDRWGATLGINHTRIGNQDGSPNLGQDAVFASGRYTFTPDRLPGQLLARMDIHTVDNNDTTRNSDSVTAFAPQIGFLSFDKRHYVDLGHAKSTYKNDLSVSQWTPTVGFGFNDGSDWLQFRGWFITPSNSNRAQGKDSTRALETKWTHWLTPNLLGIDNIKFTVIGGERIYSVDGEAGSIANLADIHRGGANLGAEWRVGRSANVQAIVGQDRFTNASTTIANDYRLNYGYLWLSNRW